jgi:hypothetical protein
MGIMKRVRNTGMNGTTSPSSPLPALSLHGIWSGMGG